MTITATATATATTTCGWTANGSDDLSYCDIHDAFWPWNSDTCEGAAAAALQKARGVVVWEGPSPVDGSPLVAVITRKTSNRKTGDMAQLWILRADIPPLEAIRTGQDAAICGGCPLRGDGTGKQRACYVVVAQAPTTVWKAYRRGVYPRAALADAARLLDGCTIRLGAYGDPAMLPYAVVRALVDAARGHTGYTHQWPTLPPVWAGILMASADSVAERSRARALGWRSFYLLPKGSDPSAKSHGMECAATRDRNPLQCADCLACGGTRDGAASRAVDVYIAPHGAGAKYVGV
jgi:hypothetical protein